ncbi:leucine-rich repeat domain-containing protein [Bacteroides ovatus]|nr:leucine-rich repeat domain-containing protein [Bacteroides ovatus]
MSRFRLVATALLVALCAGFYSCGGDNDETPLNNDDNSNISNENGNSVIVGTTAMVQLKKVGALSTLISDNVKFNITDLRIMGDINGDDIALIREMAGADVKGNETNGKLANLNLSNANLVNGGIYYTGITQEVSSSNELWQYMFYKCGSLTSIVLPNNIAHIGAFALSYSGITSFTIPNNIQTIGNEAFCHCTKLESIVIGNSIVSAAENMLDGCINLKKIRMLSDNSTYTIEGKIFQNGMLFNESKSELIRCCYLGSSNYIVPNGVKKVGDYAFTGCNQLESITFSDDVIMVGKYAFQNCHKLTSVKIGSGVSSMSETAFEGCANLDEFVVIDNKGAYSTQDGILYNRSKTKVVRCPLNKRGIINLPASIGTIGDYAFSSCTGITSIYITETGTIGSCAFSNCTNLESIHIADRWNTVTFIMDYAFENCVKLSSITIPACSKVWGEAFVGCIGMKEIHLKWGYLNSSDLGFLYRLNKDCKIFIPRGHLGTYMKYWTDIDRLVEE